MLTYQELLAISRNSVIMKILKEMEQIQRDIKTTEWRLERNEEMVSKGKPPVFSETREMLDAMKIALEKGNWEVQN
jgi:hypothetical protein